VTSGANKILKDFSECMSLSNYAPKNLEKLVEKYIFNLSKKEQICNLQILLNGLHFQEIDYNAVSKLFQCLMKFDCYSRKDVPKFSKANTTVLECTGSGKKPVKTVNISTPAIITAVSCGATIIKKGSHATSSLLGSADLMEQIGFVIPKTINEQIKLLEKTGYTFINIETVIPKYNEIYSGYYYKPHILSNTLAATVTSLRGDKIVYGLSSNSILYSAKAIMNLSEENISVYSSIDEKSNCYDEVIGNGKLKIARVNDKNVTSEEIDLKKYNTSVNRLKAPLNISEAISRFLMVLSGNDTSDYSKAVSINAAFFLIESRLVQTFDEALKISTDALKKGIPMQTLKNIINCSGGALNFRYV
jgi:anthranilate phosphoribosyltransferase